jgi:hypothetical protein
MFIISIVPIAITKSNIFSEAMWFCCQLYLYVLYVWINIE